MLMSGSTTRLDKARTHRRASFEATSRVFVSNHHLYRNYEYSFFYYFYQDGSMELEIKHSGIVNTSALPMDQPVRYSTRLNNGEKRRQRREHTREKARKGREEEGRVR